MPFSSNEKLVINIVVFLSKWPNGDYYWQSRKVTGSSCERILFTKLGEENYCTHSRFVDHREESYN